MTLLYSYSFHVLFYINPFPSFLCPPPQFLFYISSDKFINVDMFHICMCDGWYPNRGVQNHLFDRCNMFSSCIHIWTIFYWPWPDIDLNIMCPWSWGWQQTMLEVQRPMQCSPGSHTEPLWFPWILSKQMYSVI